MQRLVVTCCALAALGAPRPARALPPAGAGCPDTPLMTLAGARLELHRLAAGRATLIFYEDRAARFDNRLLKDELARLGHDPELRRRVAIVAVADLHRFAFWPARGVARRELRGEERRFGVEIYADFSGAVGRALGAEPGKSHVILVGRDGRVVLSHRGPLDESARRFIMTYLRGEGGVTTAAWR